MPTIAIVDDNEAIRDSLQTLIEATHEYRTMCAVNGAEGLSLITSSKPDLAILDINMPVMNGIELLEELKENPLTSDMPVIMLSANEEIKSVQAKIFKYADMYLSKPCTRTRLMSAIRACLAKVDRAATPAIAR